MKKRRLGKSELYVTEMGLGAMSIGTDEKEALHIISAALDEGINYFDTADLYDYGMNERIVGKALKPYRDSVIIATKVGNKWNENKDAWSWDASKSYILSAVKDSLHRLGTDYIDLYQLHGGTMEDNHEEVVEAFEQLVKEGYIRYYGISSIRPNVIDSFARKSNIQTVMMQYSILDRRPEEWMTILKENNISMIARGPVAKGLLSEKMLEKASASVKEKGYLDYSFRELEDTLHKLREIFSTRSMNEIALQYILSHDVVGAVIPGASSVKQVKENAQAVRGERLTDEEVELIKSLTKLNKYEHHRI
ncbi:aldo/keto reductase [Peribacillus tepidiphilus]|uniref:aldo/keto reductase n=1 Tax=Peribacillus tepidiphilus TaxID=2652445 RepID=UPI0012912F92|nr:aldo/keto reductase [Peribacillus tepidiphilus]